MYFCTLIQFTCIQRFSRSRFSRLSRCLSHTWTQIEYPKKCAYVHARTHAHTHPPPQHPQKCQTKTLSLPLPKHSPQRQQQALDMDKLRKTPLRTPFNPCMQVFKNTCDTHAYSGEIGQYKYKKCAYTCAYVHPAKSNVMITYLSVKNTCHNCAQAYKTPVWCSLPHTLHHIT